LPELPLGADLPAAERALSGLILAAGDDPGRPELAETPARTVRALLSLTAGYEQDPAEILADLPAEPPATLPEPSRATLSAEVPIRMACERCMLPAFGAVYLRCKPGSQRLDGSHLTRLTLCLAARLQSEPQLADQLASALVDLGGSRSARVRVTVRRPCDDCGAGRAETTATARRVARERQAAPAGGDPQQPGGDRESG
jgi:GTP cyclohydrolase I